MFNFWGMEASAKLNTTTSIDVLDLGCSVACVLVLRPPKET